MVKKGSDAPRLKQFFFRPFSFSFFFLSYLLFFFFLRRYDTLPKYFGRVLHFHSYWSSAESVGRLPAGGVTATNTSNIGGLGKPVQTTCKESGTGRLCGGFLRLSARPFHDG